jgi:hypothetical protein
MACALSEKELHGQLRHPSVRGGADYAESIVPEGRARPATVYMVEQVEELRAELRSYGLHAKVAILELNLERKLYQPRRARAAD